MTQIQALDMRGHNVIGRIIAFLYGIAAYVVFFVIMADFVVQVAGAIGTDRTGNISRHAVVGAPASTPRN